MKLLLLKGFNNYFNRKIKKYSTLDDYKDSAIKYYDFVDVNFNPNDGVSTVQIVGSENQKEDSVNILDWENEGSPDYLVCYNTVSTIVDDEETATDVIVSRWFVMESVRTRVGQYQLALKRDVIADHLEQILTNPCFVEKGYVSTEKQSLIFNDEGNSFNEIKQSEDRLYDETGVPWIVLYLAQDKPASQTPCEARLSMDTSQVKDVDELPWANLVGGEDAPITTPQAGKKYVFRGASQLVLKPVFAVAAEGYWCAPNRLILPYNYTDSGWVLASSARSEKLGAYERINSWSNVNADTLRMSDLGLGSSSEHIKSNTTGGKKVPCVQPVKINASYWGGGGHGVGYIRAISPTVETHQNITNSQRTALNSWLTSSSNTIKNTTSYDVSGNTYTFKGGDQTFISDATIRNLNNALVSPDGINYWRLNITRKNYVSTKVCYFKYENGVIVNANSSDFPGIAATNSLKNNLVNPSFLTDHPQNTSTSGSYIQYTNGSVNGDNVMCEVDYVSWEYEVEYQVVTGDIVQFNAAVPTSRQGTNDAIFDVLAFPYGALKYVIPDNKTPTEQNYTSWTSKEASLCAARATATKLTNQVVYDVQLLPYCPYREIAIEYGKMKEAYESGLGPEPYLNFGAAIDDNPATKFPLAAWSGVYKINNWGESADRANSIGIGLWCPKASGTFNIDYNIETPSEGDPVEYKLFSFCKKFRLVSPNYASAFEFNPLKNHGVEAFNVDFNYRPYNPYVHIAPVFKQEGLYGPDLNDLRGLILGGDYSVGFHSDKWAEYQVQNANYNGIFNRQIASLDVKQAIAQEQMDWKQQMGIVGAITGVAGGTVAGAQKGAKVGGGYGAIAGAILGAGASGIGAGLALEGLNKQQDWLSRSQAEERSYAIDMYNLNLGNVKALPLGLAKTDALTVNFKEVPFIETYDCTELEKEIFRNKLKYDGMTVGAIGQLSDYIPEIGPDWEFQRLKGRMIMQDNIIDDFHVSDAIYAEVNKGFYYVNSYVEPEEEGE